MREFFTIRYEVVALMTSVSEEFGAFSHHGVRGVAGGPGRRDRPAAGEVYLPSSQGNFQVHQRGVPSRSWTPVLADFRYRVVFVVGFGDLFLEDLRAWRGATSKPG